MDSTTYLIYIYESLLLHSRVQCRANTHAFRSANKASDPEAKEWLMGVAQAHLDKSRELFEMAQQYKPEPGVVIDLLPRFEQFLVEKTNVG